MDIGDGEEGPARVNIGKTKIMVSCMDLGLLKKSEKDPCCVCQKGVGSNAIFSSGCLCWIHKKSSGIKGPLCTLIMISGGPDAWVRHGLLTAEWLQEVDVKDEKLEAVPEFCYLGGHALCWQWLRACCCNMLQMCLGQVLATAFPSQ